MLGCQAYEVSYITHYMHVLWFKAWACFLPQALIACHLEVEGWEQDLSSTCNTSCMLYTNLVLSPPLQHSYRRLFVLQALIALVEDWGLTLAKFCKILSCYTNKQPPCSQTLTTLEVKVVVDNNSVKSPVYDTMIDVTSWVICCVCARDHVYIYISWNSSVENLQVKMVTSDKHDLCTKQDMHIQKKNKFSLWIIKLILHTASSVESNCLLLFFWTRYMKATLLLGT